MATWMDTFFLGTLDTLKSAPRWSDAVPVARSFAPFSHKFPTRHLQLQHHAVMNGMKDDVGGHN